MLLLAARSFVGSSGFAYDFGAYDSAARRILAGEPLYPPGAAEAYNSGDYAGLYLYPPPPAVAMVPLAVLPAQVAALAWFWLRLALLALGAALLPVPALARGAVLAVAAVSFPVWYDLNLGNHERCVVRPVRGDLRYCEKPAGSIAPRCCRDPPLPVRARADRVARGAAMGRPRGRSAPASRSSWRRCPSSASRAGAITFARFRCSATSAAARTT